VSLVLCMSVLKSTSKKEIIYYEDDEALEQIA